MGHGVSCVISDVGSDHGHAVSDSHVLRGDVIVTNDGIYFCQPKLAKGIIPASRGRFGSISMMPVASIEQVTDFMNLPVSLGLQCDAGLTDQFSAVFEDNSPQSETVFAITLQLPVQPVQDFFI